MKVTTELQYAVKEVLIDMAIDDSIPLDMTDLDIDTVFDRAIDKLKQDEEYMLDQEVHRLCEDYLCMDFEEAKKVWRNLDSRHDSDMAGDHLQMAEAFEYSFTIKDLAQLVREPIATI